MSNSNVENINYEFCVTLKARIVAYVLSDSLLTTMSISHRKMSFCLSTYFFGTKLKNIAFKRSYYRSQETHFSRNRGRLTVTKNIMWICFVFFRWNLSMGGDIKCSKWEILFIAFNSSLYYQGTHPFFCLARSSPRILAESLAISVASWQVLIYLASLSSALHLSARNIHWCSQ